VSKPQFHIFPCRHIYGDNDPSRQPERTNEAAGTYAQACIAVAKELDHPVIDIWTRMQQFPDWQTSALWYESFFPVWATFNHANLL
jgi:hypothetical protein